ncbi:uncharacterized protein CDV56_105160 [Aspergillus thermomutatus]|uniref:Alpha/beta hydrolase fold-3 domain-containing protein n=1 Tax=Aspergillus thermomutatus TaxID=41047 RepID=A0A397GY27_ASPTH|nr:uncharacterized protein CDV56_105160 [Aspergillus thermomutatus]RHZ54404.1 hypothetical protein CDV56_105160 [Aspergillus thermomutatus]
MSTSQNASWSLIHILLILIFAILHLPFWAVYYLHPQLRQNHEWSYRQALANTLIKIYLRTVSAIQMKSPLSLEPLREGGRFVVMHPAKRGLYKGVAVDKEIAPESIGGTWYPTPYPPSNSHFGRSSPSEGRMIVLHFHGGGYIIGDGRSSSCAFLASTLLSNTPSSHVFCPQYRLSCNPGGRFPAPLQDAITAYSYLIHTLRIPASRIVLSGDSAGAHLALALLRYVAELDDPSLLPAPKCAWLFSPWCNLPAATNERVWASNPNYRTDYIPASLASWAARLFLRDVELSPSTERYVAPVRHPFVLPCPVLVVTGGCEVLFAENEKLVRKFRKVAQNGFRVEFFIEAQAPHDVLLMGGVQGFREEAKRCAMKAGDFAARLRSRPTDQLNGEIWV